MQINHQLGVLCPSSLNMVYVTYSFMLSYRISPTSCNKTSVAKNMEVLKNTEYCQLQTSEDSRHSPKGAALRVSLLLKKGVGSRDERWRRLPGPASTVIISLSAHHLPSKYNYPIVQKKGKLTHSEVTWEVSEPPTKTVFESDEEPQGKCLTEKTNLMKQSVPVVSVPHPYIAKEFQK